MKKQDERCPNCGAAFKSKYMFRVDHKYEDPKAKSHWESTSKKSIVGWIKFICNNYQFEEIQIFNLLTECPVHKEHWENEGTKTASEKPPEESNFPIISET